MSFQQHGTSQPTVRSSSQATDFSLSSPALAADSFTAAAAHSSVPLAPVPSMSLRSNSLPDLPSLLPLSPSSSSSPASHESAMSSDDTALAVLASAAAATPLTSHQRQLARNALLLGISKASSLRSSSTVVRFSLDTMNSLVPGPARRMAVGSWMEYGEPMLKRIDERLDDAVNAIANATSGLQHVYAYNPAAAAAAAGASSQASALVEQHMEHEPFSASSHSSTSSSLSHDSLSASQQLVPVPSPTASSLYAAYWERLKSKFISSHWYTKVDHILLQNSVVHAFTHHLLHPAEVFFATVTEEFLASQQSQEEFLASLQQRVGPAWDERLAPLAKGFYTTAKAVSAVVGAGRFVGGVMQLGKMRVDGVMEDLLKQWDRVLGLGDDMMDRYLPEVEGGEEVKRIESGRMEDDERDEKKQTSEDSQTSQQERWEQRVDASVATTEDDAASVPSAASSSYLHRPLNDEGPRLRRSGKKRSSEHLDRYEQENESLYTDDSDDEVKDAHDSPYDALSSSLALTALPSHPDRTGQVLITKFGKRLRQRMPTALSPPLSLASFSSDLKQRLIESSWFTLVDDILMQNALVKALAAFVRPAEHFFQTSLLLWSSQQADDIKMLEAATDDAQEDGRDAEETMEGLAGESAEDERLRLEKSGMEDEGKEASSSAHGRSGEEGDSGGAMQLDNSSPESSPAPPFVTPTFSSSLFTTVNPAASFSSSPLPAPRTSHTLASQQSASHSMSASLPVSSQIQFTTSAFPATATATATRSPPSAASIQPLSSTSPTFIPRVFPPSPSSFLHPANISPSTALSSTDPVFDDFAFHLRERLGGSWDDRLYQPTRSFYQTAQSIRPKPTA